MPLDCKASKIQFSFHHLSRIKMFVGEQISPSSFSRNLHRTLMSPLWHIQRAQVLCEKDAYHCWRVLCWDLSHGKWSRLLLLPLHRRTKSPTSQKQACKAIIAQMEKLKGPPPLTVSRLTRRPWFSSQTEKGNPILFEKTGRSFFSLEKMDRTNYTQNPNISTTGCWKTIEPPLAARSPQNTLQEANCRIWVEAEPRSPLKAHQNCNKTPLFEMKLSNCYFTPTFCWSPFKSSPLTLFQMKMFSFLGSGRGLIHAAPCTSEVWVHMQNWKGWIWLLSSKTVTIKRAGAYPPSVISPHLEDWKSWCAKGCHI